MANNQDILKIKFSDVFDQSPDAIFLVDVANQRIQAANPRANELTGFFAEDLGEIPFSRLLGPAEQLPQMFQSLLAQGQFRSRDLSFLYAQGRSRPAEVAATLVQIDGNPSAVMRISEIIPGRDLDQRHQLFEDMLHAIAHPFYIVDAKDYKIVVANPAARKRGVEISGACYSITHRRDAPCSQDNIPCPLEMVRKTGKPAVVEHIHYNGKGEPRYYEVHGYPILDPQGRVAQMIEYSIDITARKEVEQELRRVSQELEFEKKKLEQVLNIDQKISSFLKLNHLVDFIIEKAVSILEADKCSLMMLDEETGELSIRGAHGLDEEIIKSARVKLGQPIAGQVAQEGRPFLIEDIEEEPPFQRKSRSHYRGKSFLSVPIQVHGKMVGVVNVADKKAGPVPTFNQMDLRILTSIVRQAAISIENASYYQKLEHLSILDPLTEVFNYRYFITALDQEIHRRQRYQQPLTLLMIDIDEFKTYNDTFGHLEGDQLLRSLSQALKSRLRAVDVLCRYAGDEFVVILPATDLAQAKVAAQKIRDVAADLKTRRKVTLSIGLAQCHPEADRRDLILKADQALYRAKRDGKNRICV